MATPLRTGQVWQRDDDGVQFLIVLAGFHPEWPDDPAATLWCALNLPHGDESCYGVAWIRDGFIRGPLLTADELSVELTKAGCRCLGTYSEIYGPTIREHF